MGVMPRLIFRKKLWIPQFSHIVIISPGSCQCRIAANVIHGCFRQICHNQTMVICPRRLNHQLPQQFVVGIGQFHQSQWCVCLKHIFPERQTAHSHNHGQQPRYGANAALEQQFRRIPFSEEKSQRNGSHKIHCRHTQRRRNQMGTLVRFLNDEGSKSTADEGVHQKLHIPIEDKAPNDAEQSIEPQRHSSAHQQAHQHSEQPHGNNGEYCQVCQYPYEQHHHHVDGE